MQLLSAIKADRRCTIGTHTSTPTQSTYPELSPADVPLLRAAFDEALVQHAHLEPPTLQRGRQHEAQRASTHAHIVVQLLLKRVLS